MIRKSNYKFLCAVLFICFCFVHSLCPYGYFKIDSMQYCFPWLNCSHIPEIKIKQLVGYGSTKNVYLAEWNNRNVSYISVRNNNFLYDFHHGLSNMKSLNPSNLVIQLVGFCEAANIIITEYHDYNNALSYNELKETLSRKERFKFCLQYSKIISFLHNSPIGIRVHCDSNDLTKSLSQFLITRDLNLILNDLDSLPEVTANSSILCGLKEIKSHFAAPEQLWLSQSPFKINKMKAYDEKTDIWKLPDICNFFLMNEDLELLQYKLFKIHKSCKEVDPSKRPTAKEVVDVYNEIFAYL